MPVRSVEPPGHRRGPARCGRDRGQTTVLAALLVGLAALLLVALTHLGGAAVDRARARTAADAAALAGVLDETTGSGTGRPAAAAIAAANGATLVAYRVDGPAVEVTVQVDDARATSRADRAVGTDG